MSHYLVVAHQTATSSSLIDCIKNVLQQDGEARFTLLVPATPVEHLGAFRQGDARDIAGRVARAGRLAFEEAGAEVVRTAVGDPSPLLAIDDELRTHPSTYQSIIVGTLPEGASRWLRVDLPQRAEEKFGIRVVHVTAEPAETAITMAGGNGAPAEGGSMIPVVVSHLIRALAGDQPLPPREARNALVALGPLARPYLLEATGHANPNLRLGALKVLARTATPECATVLIDALQDRDGGIRYLAAEGLVRAGPKVIPPLLAALMRHSDSAWLHDGTRHVLQALRRHPDYREEALAPVCSSLNGSSSSVTVMMAANEALRDLAAPAAGQEASGR